MRLLVIRKVPGKTRNHWLCLCDCGKETVVSPTNLLSGNTKSCGCYSVDRTREVHTTHGLSHTRPNNIYKAMLSRTGNPNDSHYANYGGRGIKVCDSWLEAFSAFWEDMEEGYQDTLTLERKNYNEGYSKENCVWATYKKQARNTRQRITNKSGVTGVCYSEKKHSWIAQWMKLDGKVGSKTFSVSRHGDEAFNLAVEARKLAIAELNAQGAGYSDAHGL